jgi:hypothetical protein
MSSSGVTGPWDHLTPENEARLATILKEQVTEVFKLIRVIEHETGYTCEIGRNNLNDALSHMGTLALRDGLDAVGQASQLSKIEEHIRRAVIEHPEEVVRDRLGKIRDRWLDYERECYPYRETGTLSGAPRHDELEELRARIAKHLETARSQKPDEATWEESLDAAAAATQAAHLAVELADKLEQSIGIAQNLRRQEELDRKSRRRWRIGLVLAVLLAVGGFVAGRLTDEDTSSTKTVTSPASTAPRTSGP